jgi:hypothetical protein
MGRGLSGCGAVLDPDGNEAVLLGLTFDGIEIAGADSVRIGRGS